MSQELKKNRLTIQIRDQPCALAENVWNCQHLQTHWFADIDSVLYTRMLPKVEDHPSELVDQPSAQLNKLGLGICEF